MRTSAGMISVVMFGIALLSDAKEVVSANSSEIQLTNITTTSSREDNFAESKDKGGIPVKDAVNGEGESDIQFIASIKTGFDRDMKGKPLAKWLGAGSVDVISNSYTPDVASHMKEWNFERDGYPDGSEWLSKIPLEEIRNGRERGQVHAQRTVCWAAWVSETGTINLALDFPLAENELNAIESVLTCPNWKGWNIKTDFAVIVIYCIGNNPNYWLLSNEARYSWLTLGNCIDGQEEKSFDAAKNILIDMKILLNWKSNTAS